MTRARDDQGRFAPELDMNTRLRIAAGLLVPAPESDPEPAEPTAESGPERGTGFDGGQHGQLTAAAGGREPEPDDMNQRIRNAIAARWFGTGDE